jgi:hypothetical protein
VPGEQTVCEGPGFEFRRGRHLCYFNNYGGILIVWDRLFRSFVPEGKRPTYGLTTNIGTFNLLKVGFHEYGSILRDLRAAPSWRERAAYVFGPPGWSPARGQRGDGPIAATASVSDTV